MRKNFNMGTQKNRLLTLFLVCILMLLAGCSMLRVAYSYGENLSYWWLDGYIDIEQDQKVPLIYFYWQ